MWERIGETIVQFLRSPQVVTIVALIGADVLSGLGAAIKHKEFSWQRLADFYATNLLPFVIGYLAIWLVAEFAVADLLGDYAYIASQGVKWAAWLAIVGTLVGSIVSNLKEIGMPVEPPDEGPLPY